ncbi:MAG: AbrB/MazE/SpoVT family DNA-binding domain-containing protein [Nanoarchaeota archaeon]
MKRKIIKQGHNTLTITLPSDWVRKFNLKSGNEIDLIEKDNGLFISTEKKNEKKRTEFDISEMDIPTIWKYFMAVYREGYDEVYVKFSPSLKINSPYKFFSLHKLDIKYGRETKKETGLEFLHSLVNRFIGFEIADYGKNFVLIKEMGELTTKEFDNSLRRIFFLIQQMCEETNEALISGNPKILSHIHDVDVNLDKFHDYCIRILNKLGNKETKKISILFSILYLLELVGDEFKNISHHLLYDFSHKFNFKNIQPIADSVKEQLNFIYEIYYKFDFKKIKKISEMDKTRYFNVKKMYDKTKTKEEKEVFHHLRIITRYINALTELIIEKEF